MRWIRITSAHSIPPREGRAVRLGSLSLAVFNTGEDYVVVENRCPHQGGPLADGIVGGNTVTCPLHNWRVCLDSGEVTRPCEAGTPRVRTFDCKVENGVILLALEEARLAA